MSEDDELRRRQREEEAARDRVWDAEDGRGDIQIRAECPVCGQDHREDHRGSDGGWVDFPDHAPANVTELLVP